MKQALRYAPNDPEVPIRAAQFYAHNGDLDTAHKYLRRATRLGPNNPLVLASLAFNNVYRGRLEEAIALQRRVVAFGPLGSVDRGNLAAYLVGAGRYEEAFAEAQKALDLNPGYRTIFERLVVKIYIAQERFGEALDIVEAWPADDAERDWALALLYDRLGRRDEADAALERLLARPGAGAAFGIAEFHAYRGDIDEAFDWLETSFDRSHSYETWANEARLTPFLRALHDDPRWEPLLAAQSR